MLNRFLNWLCPAAPASLFEPIVENEDGTCNRSNCTCGINRTLWSMMEGGESGPTDAEALVLPPAPLERA